MESLTIGSLVISDDESGITFRDEERGEIILQARGVTALFDFLRSSSVNPANRRRGFRIPLDPEDGLRATVVHDGVSFDAMAMDISLSGIRVAAQDSTAPDLEVGSAVTVTLHLDADSTTLRSEIRRRAGEGYGIVFLDALEGDEPAPPPNFARLIAKLERRWLEQITSVPGQEN